MHFKVPVLISTKTDQNIFDHTSIFVLFSPVHTDNICFHSKTQFVMFLSIHPHYAKTYIRKQSQENMCADWLKIMFLELESNIELARAVDVTRYKQREFTF